MFDMRVNDVQLILTYRLLLRCMPMTRNLTAPCLEIMEVARLLLVDGHTATAKLIEQWRGWDHSCSVYLLSLYLKYGRWDGLCLAR